MPQKGTEGRKWMRKKEVDRGLLRVDGKMKRSKGEGRRGRNSNHRWTRMDADEEGLRFRTLNLGLHFDVRCSLLFFGRKEAQEMAQKIERMIRRGI